MGQPPETMHERLPATPESVGAARRRVASFAADFGVDLDSVVLAVGGGSPRAGFGLTIIRRIAEQVELTDTPDGVSLTMGFRRGEARSGV